MVKDVLQAWVRVPSSRLLYLKAKLSWYDWRIQQVTSEIEYMEYCGKAKLNPKIFNKLIQDRAKLDHKRKKIRLEAKGYGKQD